MAPRKKKFGALIFAAGLLLVLGISVLVLSAQSDRGTITGTVTDQTGAAIVGVSVTGTNTGTGITSNATSGANGSYTIPLLPAGTYQVSAEHAGFKRFISSDVAIQVGQTARLDVPMQLGGLNETVEVQADAPGLLPNTSDLGTVITRQDIQDLPLIGQSEVRNPTSFLILVPGVTGRGTAFGADRSGGGSFDARYLSTTVNGSQSGSTEFHLDGSIIASAGEFSADPRNVGFPPDAVAGFKMITLNAPAEYGRSGGALPALPPSREQTNFMVPSMSTSVTMHWMPVASLLLRRPRTGRTSLGPPSADRFAKTRPFSSVGTMAFACTRRGPIPF